MMDFAKPWSQACENNKQPIADILCTLFADVRSVLELGSGTGQHAVHMAGQMPWLTWQASDLLINHQGIRAWLAEASNSKLKAPLLLDVDACEWPCGEHQYDAVFTANTLHIMSWQSVIGMFTRLPRYLAAGGSLCVYGPFNYAGQYTSPSNAQFDAWLGERDPKQGIRNFENVDALAQENGLLLQNDYAMPANNRLLHWRFNP